MGSRIPVLSPLSPDEQRELLALGRIALERYVLAGEIVEIPPAERGVSPRLMAAQGVFVSLHRGTRLRGCVGYSEPIKPLAIAVMENAISAAVRDMRFPPVDSAEVPEILIEISVMSATTELKPEDVVVGLHGILVESGGHRGLLLPQVATEHHWDREEFLDQLCLKAGLPIDAWKARDARLHGFTAQVFSESKPGSQSTSSGG